MAVEFHSLFAFVSVDLGLSALLDGTHAVGLLVVGLVGGGGEKQPRVRSATLFASITCSITVLNGLRSHCFAAKQPL